MRLVECSASMDIRPPDSTKPGSSLPDGVDGLDALTLTETEGPSRCEKTISPCEVPGGASFQSTSIQRRTSSATRPDHEPDPIEAAAIPAESCRSRIHGSSAAAENSKALRPRLNTST